MTNYPKSGIALEKERREKRKAEALRENLRKRKTQQRKRNNPNTS